LDRIERGDEGFCQSVVVGTAYPAHRGDHSFVLQPLTEGQIGVLYSLDGVVYESRSRLAPRYILPYRPLSRAETATTHTQLHER
jgi:hypothetical protein